MITQGVPPIPAEKDAEYIWKHHTVLSKTFNLQKILYTEANSLLILWMPLLEWSLSTEQNSVDMKRRNVDIINHLYYDFS